MSTGTEHYIFRGKALYPMLVKPDSYMGKSFWKIGVKLDEASEKLFKKSGLGLRPKKSDDPELDGFYVFRRNTTAVFKGKEHELMAPKIEGWDPNEVQLGNGSEVEVLVEVYPTRFANKGHRLVGVKALKVVPYEGSSSQMMIHTPEGDVTPEADTKKEDTKLNDEIPF